MMYCWSRRFLFHENIPTTVVAFRTGKVGHCLGGCLQEWVENKRSVNFHRFDLGDAGGPIDSKVGDLCNHVGFTDV
jgi:hypothetical protein